MRGGVRWSEFSNIILNGSNNFFFQTLRIRKRTHTFLFYIPFLTTGGQNGLENRKGTVSTALDLAQFYLAQYPYEKYELSIHLNFIKQSCKAKR